MNASRMKSKRWLIYFSLFSISFCGCERHKGADQNIGEIPKLLWAGADTIFVSQHAARDKADAHAVIQSYIAHGHGAAAFYPHGETDSAYFKYGSAHPDGSWHGEPYWEVLTPTHRYLYIDQRGTIVLARPPDSTAVIVKKLQEPLPHDRKVLEQFIWQRLANKPEERQFADYTTERSEGRFQQFSRSLVGKAREASLDFASLDSCLSRVCVEAHGKVYLPVGAYAGRQGDLPVWVIVVKWEDRIAPGFLYLGHVRIYALSAVDYKVIGFMTCD